ncbi:hypothetical protein MCEMKE14_01376 [Candidatus Nanopelagicaceae bacterium]
MAGNSERKGAIRGSKKGPSAGTGGKNKKRLAGKGPTPKAEDRPYHAAAKRKKLLKKQKLILVLAQRHALVLLHEVQQGVIRELINLMVKLSPVVMRFSKLFVLQFRQQKYWSHAELTSMIVLPNHFN